MSYGKRKCKNCGEVFEKKQPLQYVCTPLCAVERAKKLEKKIQDEKWKKTKKEWLPEAKTSEYKSKFQKAINKLAKNIDKAFGFNTCIDCDRCFKDKSDMHGAHFHSVGSNNSLRYNLHNIHTAKSNCNQYDPKHHEQYKEGLKKRYGEKYLKYVDNEMPLQYPEIKLSNKDIFEKLAIVRKINREFDTFKLENPIKARDYFNTIIGIY